jgi:hypothetical protein
MTPGTVDPVRVDEATGALRVIEYAEESEVLRGTAPAVNGRLSLLPISRTAASAR